MKKLEIDIAGRSVIDVSMTSDVLGLNEVVVTALYGLWVSNGIMLILKYV